MAEILDDGDEAPVAPVTEKAEKALATLSEARGAEFPQVGYRFDDVGWLIFFIFIQLNQTMIIY